MGNRTEFIQRQHDEVRQTLERLRQHAAAFDEEAQEAGAEDETWKPLAEEARSGVAALEPVLSDFDNAGVDPEELIQYADVIEFWQGREAEFTKKLS